MLPATWVTPFRRVLPAHDSAVLAPLRRGHTALFT